MRVRSFIAVVDVVGLAAAKGRVVLLGAHPVTNVPFRAYIEATGCVTVAERQPDGEALRQQLPPGT